MTTTLSERKKYPIYILLDVSASMRHSPSGGRPPQAAFNEMIPDLVMSLSDSRSLAKAAWISVIAFGNEPELLCPMTALTDPVLIRSPQDGTQTNYVAALRFLHDRIGLDGKTIEARGAGQHHRTKVAPPLVFFITDGAPYASGRYQLPEEWMPHRNRIVSAPVSARIAAIGLTGAHPGTLAAIATGRPGGQQNAFIATSGATGDSLAGSVITVIERSIKLSVQAGEMVIEVPDGMRRVDG